MKYLADSKGRIEIPFTLGGSLDGISVRPDLKFVGKAMGRAAGNARRDKASNPINNALLRIGIMKVWRLRRTPILPGMDLQDRPIF